MKKELEVLQAAEAGNVVKLEALFEQRQSKVLAGFFKGPNINWRNENGCTALHLASLNGHSEAVIFLLHNDGSANTPDNAGSFPLHLAAFNGHAEIARILLERGPSKARVNETNMTGDTPLHVAAQYNHHTVMDVLLKHHADIYQRNIKEETALDLAAQYGRFDAVQMLIFKDLGILKEAVHKHSPLHLAARNGHISVVNLLLDSGMPINALCDMGTALHAAALFGKVKVAKLLLRRGINIEIEDSNNQKVVDLLCKIPSKISQQINTLIYEHSGLMPAKSEKKVRQEATHQRQRPESMPTRRLPTYDYVPTLKKPPEQPSLPTQYAQVQGIGKSADRLSNYDEYGLASVTGTKKQDVEYMSNNELHSPYSLVDIRSNSSIGSYKQLEYNRGKVDSDRVNHYETEHSSNAAAEDDYLEVDKVLRADLNEKRSSTPDFPPPSPETASSIVSEIIRTTSITKATDSRERPESFLDEQQKEMLTDAANNLLGVKNLSRSVPMNIGMNRKLSAPTSMEEDTLESYDNVALKNTPVNTSSNQNESPPDLTSYDNVNLCSTLRVSPSIPSYNNVEFNPGGGMKIASTQQPQSSYDNVHLKNIPIPPNETLDSSKKEESVKQKRTVVSKVVVLEGEQHGEQHGQQQGGPQGEPYDSHVKPTSSNIYQTVTLTESPTPKPRTKVKQTRTTVKSRDVSHGYRMSEIVNKETIDETYEWNKIDKFVSDLEHYAEEPDEAAGRIDSILSWLSSLELSQYEPMFITNGFDNVAFLKGVLTDQDLIQMGILHSEHRKKIIDSVSTLSECPVFGTELFAFPSSVAQWLSALKLPQYERRFIYYGYNNMERVRVIWELELVTVLEITTLGHYKRMLCSLGKQHGERVGESWSPTKLSESESDSGSKVNLREEDDSMDVAKQLLETAESLKIERQHRMTIISETVVNLTPTPETNASDTRSVSCEWIHSSATLLAGSVSYTLQYLGSHPVSEVKGVESTLEACSKMKNLSKNIQKLPSVMLAISVRGIDYMDANTKMVISQYAINNISYCAQDTEELTIFAYITRDECTRKHYCHVFKVPSTELADEFIITIGQCFELAYQIHLETINNRDASLSASMSRAMSLASRLPDKDMDVVDAKISSGTLPPRCNTESATRPRVPPRPPKPYTGNISGSNGDEV